MQRTKKIRYRRRPPDALRVQIKPWLDQYRIGNERRKRSEVGYSKEAIWRLIAPEGEPVLQKRACRREQNERNSGGSAEQRQDVPYRIRC